MSSFKTMLDDAISSTKERSVYRIPAGIRVNTKKIRLLDFKLQRKDPAGQVQDYLFGLGGSVEIIRKVSVVSHNGVEIDRMEGYGTYFQGLKNAIAENSVQYGVNSLINHNLDLSVLCPDFSEVKNGNPYTADNKYWSMNNHFQTINISNLLQYLSVARSVSADGMEIVLEWNFSAMEADGSSYEFVGGYPKIAYDVYLDGTPVDVVPKSGFVYFTLATDSIPIRAGQVIERVDKRLASYNKQYIASMYYLIKNGEDLALSPLPHLTDLHAAKLLTAAPTKESFQLIIDGVQLFSKKAITKSAHKQSILNDQFNEITCPSGSNCDLVARLELITDGRLSVGVAPINRFVNDELVLQYENIKPHVKQSAFITIAEVLRGYSPVSDMTYFVSPA